MAGIIKTDDINQEATTIGWDVARYVYQTQIDALVHTLEIFCIPHSYYSILKEKEDSVCLVCDEDGWKEFTSERGLQTELMIFDSVEDACERLIYTMAEDDDEERDMMKEFHNRLSKNQESKFHMQELMRILKDSIQKISSSAAAL